MRVLSLLFFLSSLLPFTAMAGVDGFDERIETLMEQNRLLMEQNKSLSRRLEAVEKKLADVQNTRQPDKTVITNSVASRDGKPWYDNIVIDGGMTGVIQGTANNGNNNPEGGDHFDGAYTLDLNLHAEMDDYGEFHLHLEGGDGEGLNDNVLSFSVPNYDAYATLNNANLADLTLSEVYYENSFFKETLIFDMGKMDLSVLFDENEVAGDETTQFLSNIFVKSMGVLIPEPDEFYCPTIMFQYAPVKIVEMKLIGAAVDTGDGHVWEDLFSNGFLAGQINFRPEIMGRQGNYRFYGWFDSRRYLDNKYLSNLNNATPDNHRSGFGLSFDQEIVDDISIFARYSWSDDDISAWNGEEGAWEMIPINQIYTIGAGIGGIYWNRPDDRIGIGFGQTILAGDFEDIFNNTANEKYIETYYRFHFNRYLTLSADFQWIQNPGGFSDNDDVYIFGMRSQIDF